MKLNSHLIGVFCLAALVIMTLPVLAATNEAGPTDWFFGELHQWETIEANTVQSNGGQLRAVKAVQTSDSLYLYADTLSQDAAGIFYLDTGRDPFGYLGRGLWGSEVLIDFKVEDATLYSYDGSGFDDTWRKVGPVETIEIAEAPVTRVSLADLRLQPGHPIKVAFYLNGLDYLPSYGTPMLTATQVETAADWELVEGTLAVSTPSLTLHAVRDHQKLFVMVEGENLNPKNTYFINTQADAGMPLPLWQDGMANFKVENGVLYKNESTRWNKVAPVHTYTTADAVVMSVDLALLEVESGDVIELAYSNNKEHFIPSANQPMLTVTSVVQQPIEANAFYPVEYHGELNNPFKGWAPSALYGPYHQPHRLVHAYISWRELEPERGVFDWEALEAKNYFDHWESKGVKLITRIMMDYPTTDPNHMDIPDWLYEMIDGDGTWYQTSEIGSGFSPNYSNPILIAEHERMIKAFGERYNDDPRIAYIQLGSIGHWGEWHTWPNGSGDFPEEEVANAYIQHYMDYLDQKMLGIRRPLPYTRNANFGYFNDRIGHAETTEQWLFWINNGMDYDNWYNRRVYPGASVADFWHTAYSAGEFGSGNALAWLRDDTVSDTLRQVREMHTSWIGPCSPAGYGQIPEQANISEVLKTIGYHFVVEKVVHEPEAMPGQNLEVNMTWNNKGVAPFYFPWHLEVGLVNEEGDLAFTTITDIDIREWLPGRHSITINLPVNPDLPEGSYTLVTAIIDPATGEPGVDLGIEGRRNDGRYLLSSITVSNN